MLGQELKEGDIIAWSVGASGSRAIGLTVGKLIAFGTHNKVGWQAGSSETPNSSGFANWTVTAKPLHSAYKSHYWSDRNVHIKKVGNILRLNMTEQELEQKLSNVETTPASI